MLKRFRFLKFYFFGVFKKRSTINDDGCDVSQDLYVFFFYHKPQSFNLITIVWSEISTIQFLKKFHRKNYISFYITLLLYNQFQ